MLTAEDFVKPDALWSLAALVRALTARLQSQASRMKWMISGDR